MLLMICRKSCTNQREILRVWCGFTNQLLQAEILKGYYELMQLLVSGTNRDGKMGDHSSSYCIIKSAAKSELLENKIQVKSCCENLHSVCTEASKLK